MTTRILTQNPARHKGEAAMLFTAIFGQYLDNLAETDRMTYIPLRWEMPEGNSTKVVYCASIDDATNIIDDLNARAANVFFGVAPRIGRVPRLRKKAIPHVLTLHVDVDGGAAEERKLRSLRPSFMTHSGSRYHCHGFFILDTPLTARTHGQLAEQLNKQIAKEVGGDLIAADISRVLRVPGTLNLKNPKQPQRVEIIEANESYSFEELSERFGHDLRVPEVETVKRAIKSSARRCGYYVKPEEEAELERLLEKGLTGPHSRERATQLLIRYYYGQGMDDPQLIKSVTQFLEANHNGFSVDWNNNPKWCRENIKLKVKNFRKKAYAPKYTPAATHNWKTFELSEKDVAFIKSQVISKWDKAFLRDALKFILSKESTDGTVFISARYLCKFKGANPKNYRRKRELLTRLGILELLHTERKRERKAPTYRVLYQK